MTAIRRGRSGRGAILGRLVLRRILLAIPTLFGISLVTFALVNLAPGEPAAGTGGAGMRSTAVTREAAENVRRTYGLDLPVFLNFDVQDRKRRVARSLRELDQPARAPLAERRLVSAGTLAMDELVTALDKAAPAKQIVLRRILLRIFRAMQVPEPKHLASLDAVRLKGWWHKRLPGYRPAALRAVAKRVAAGNAGYARDLRPLHRRAVPALIEQLFVTGDPQARARLTGALSDITGHVVLYEPNAPRAERRSVMGQWRDWWRAEETVHRDLSGSERFVSTFTRTRYARWLGRLVRGDFGESHYFKQRAADIIAERLPITLALNLAALLLAYLLSVPLGVWSAVNRGRWLDRAVTAGLFVLYSLPTFWVALMLIIFLGGIEGPNLFPTSGLHSFRPEDYPAGSALLDLVWHAVLPVFCLSYAALAVVSRYQRAGMVQVLGQDYIRTARAKGLGEGQVVWKHGLRNGIIPLVNLLGLQIPYLLSGSVIIESIFDIPGLGSLTLLAIQQRDTNVLMGVISITALLTMAGLLLADLLMLWADPRISLERSPEAGP